MIYFFSVNNSLVMAKHELEIVNELDEEAIKSMVIFLSIFIFLIDNTNQREGRTLRNIQNTGR